MYVNERGKLVAKLDISLMKKIMHGKYMELIQYEQQIRPHVQAQQKNARGFARSFVPASSLGLYLQQAIMKVMLREAFIGLLRRQFGAQSILQP